MAFLEETDVCAPHRTTRPTRHTSLLNHCARKARQTEPAVSS